jgi:hypothetical protein
MTMIGRRVDGARPMSPLLHMPRARGEAPAAETQPAIDPRRRAAKSSTLARFQWLLLLAWSMRNTLFVRQRASNTFASIDAAAGVQVAFVGLSALLLLASGKLGEMLGNSRSPLQPLILYYALCMLSALWSPMPAYTFYRALEALILVASATAAMMTARDQESAERTLLILGLVTVLLSMGQNIRLLGLGAMTTLYGWHTNTYTAVAAVCLVYAFGEHHKAVGVRRKRLQWAMVWSLAAVVVGTSSASNVSAVSGLMAAAVLQRRYGLIALLAAVGLVAVLALLYIHGSLFEMVGWLFPGKSDYELQTLSGRTHIWGLYWESWLSRPVLGHGFGVLTLANGYAIRLYSHNGFIATVLGCGIVGGLLAVWFVLRLAAQSLRGLRWASPGAIGGAAALVTALVNTNAMPMFLELWEESNLVSTALVAYLVYFVWNREPRRVRSALLARG